MFVHTLPETESTNDVARTMAQAGAPHGTVVHALRQTHGRGRRQRVWWSPDAGALLMSVVLRPTGPITGVASLALEIGVAIVDVVAEHGIVASVKWPNDVFVGDQKISGVLCELTDDARGRWAVIVGIGLNCNIDAAAFPDALAGQATSTLAQTGTPLAIADLVRALAARVLDRFTRFDALGLDVDAVNAVSNMRGARVRGEDGREGVAHAIASSGALRVHWDGAAGPTDVVAGDVVRVMR